MLKYLIYLQYIQLIWWLREGMGVSITDCSEHVGKKRGGGGGK